MTDVSAGGRSDAPARRQTPRTQKVGRVVSDKMEKTVVVAVDYVRRHRLYHKRITRTSKFMAHDEKNECKPGDIVRIEETRPTVEATSAGSSARSSSAASRSSTLAGIERLDRGRGATSVIQHRSRLRVADNSGATGDHVHPRARRLVAQVRRRRRHHHRRGQAGAAERRASRRAMSCGR